jgi:hypothetical protein
MELIWYERLVKTPLWTGRPEIMKQFGFTEENCIMPEAVAEAMIDLVSDEKYVGGTCLEIAVGGTRTLGTWNIEPPSGYGTQVPKEVIEANYAPILAKLQQERGGT